MVQAIDTQRPPPTETERSRGLQAALVLAILFSYPTGLGASYAWDYVTHRTRSYHMPFFAHAACLFLHLVIGGGFAVHLTDPSAKLLVSASPTLRKLFVATGALIPAAAAAFIQSDKGITAEAFLAIGYGWWVLHWLVILMLAMFEVAGGWATLQSI